MKVASRETFIGILHTGPKSFKLETYIPELFLTVTRRLSNLDIKVDSFLLSYILGRNNTFSNGVGTLSYQLDDLYDTILRDYDAYLRKNYFTIIRAKKVWRELRSIDPHLVLVDIGSDWLTFGSLDCAFEVPENNLEESRFLVSENKKRIDSIPEVFLRTCCQFEAASSRKEQLELIKAFLNITQIDYFHSDMDSGLQFAIGGVLIEETNTSSVSFLERVYDLYKENIDENIKDTKRLTDLNEQLDDSIVAVTAERCTSFLLSSPWCIDSDTTIKYSELESLDLNYLVNETKQYIDPDNNGVKFLLPLVPQPLAEEIGLHLLKVPK